MLHLLFETLRYFLIILFFLAGLYVSFAQEGEDLPEAPPDPDISDTCTLSDCNPAKPCADPDESCYSVNGVFYCCVLPPAGGMPAVGD